MEMGLNTRKLNECSHDRSFRLERFAVKLLQQIFGRKLPLRCFFRHSAQREAPGWARIHEPFEAADRDARIVLLQRFNGHLEHFGQPG